ncbi:PIN domain-containing protein [Spirosoma sp. BT702]|uniref:PIN domain-containing protein n=1 Tax=Spirosoma profusum TaxID=2771354 RepID=A0A926XZJ0_9BACT|nr:PIN domain-containing protein [Spirosoma profusum]MBD2703823.1 PIN domain-containing protein [Spirosoma profusum]
MAVVFIDTNCWVYASNPQSPFYTIAHQKFAEFQERDYEICSCPQIIKEYTRVLTSEGILSPESISQKAAFIRESTTFLSETSGTIAEFDTLIDKFQVKAKSVYDCSSLNASL